MGAQPSKPEAASDKELLQRLGELQVRNEDEHHDSGSEKRGIIVHREPEGLPVQVLQSWQSSFLKDPKNRYVTNVPPLKDQTLTVTSTDSP